MSTTAVFAAVAATNATIAAAESSEAHTAACQAVLSTFDAKTASVEQAQIYAECVQRVYPKSETHIDPIVAKVGILVLIIATIVGAVRGWKDDGLVGAFMVGLMALCGAFVTSGLLVLAGVGLAFVFGA